MQLGNVTTDAAKDYGITFVRTQFNASQPATIQNGTHTEQVQVGQDDGGAPIFEAREVPTMVPNPALFATDFDYAAARIGAMVASAVDSWAKQADEASANPPPSADPGSVTSDWRPQAATDLNIYRAKLVGILTAMQMDYTARGEAANAAACLDAKAGVLVIDKAPGVVDAYQAVPGSRSGFDLAVKTRWLQIVAPAPALVKSDFSKYGGNTV